MFIPMVMCGGVGLLAFVVAGGLRETSAPHGDVERTPAGSIACFDCRHRVSVNDRGERIVSVSSGWVLLEGYGRTAQVPAGARCAMRVGIGPGTPSVADATPALVAALSRLDFEGGGERALAIVLEQTRPEDAITLETLADRLHGEAQRSVRTRLTELSGR